MLYIRVLPALYEEGGFEREGNLFTFLLVRYIPSGQLALTDDTPLSELPNGRKFRRLITQRKAEIKCERLAKLQQK